MSPELVSAGIAVASFIAGQWVPRPHRRRVKPPKPVEPICGCDHHHSYHDPKTGECHGQVRGKPLQYDGYGYATAWGKAQCTCKQYTGPTPLPEVYAPEITS